LNAFQNVADTLYSLDADQRSLDVAYKGEKANQDIYILTQNQFKNGYVSAIQLLGTKQNWLTAKANSLNARMNYLMDTVALFQAMGGGWRASDMPPNLSTFFMTQPDAQASDKSNKAVTAR
jgi:outer membrane protein TolC